MTQATSARAGSIRRMRRRHNTSAANGRIFCSTNGCASFLVLDPTGLAICPVCGFRRRTS
ncbi:MAG: hypothetical protein M3P84_10930 [Chloroflexota bacterium]|nr:hypothetical protein [Chloroflexota bacterium]